MKTAILYGADAVYCGTPDLSLRTKARLTLEQLVEGIEFAHSRNKKVYLTLNLFSHNKDIGKLNTMIDTIKKAKPDGVIIADPGVFQLVKERAPELELHISTQANVCSYLTVDYWKKQGAKLVVLAREVSFGELTEIREKCPDIKLEAFIHGAMCMTYSGRCLLSNYLAERGANQGNCAQSCRWNYKIHLKLKDGTIKELNLTDENKDLFEFLLEEDFRPGEFMPIEESHRGSYILNAKDLCLMPKLDDYLKLGIDSLKVEGRNKTAYYAAIVTRSYRMAIDDWNQDPQNWDHKNYMQELYTLQNRGFSLAFHDDRLTHHAHNYDSTKSVSHYEYAGFIRDWEKDDIIFEIKNRIESGDLIELISPLLKDPIRLRLQEFKDSNTGEVTTCVSAGQNKAIRINKNLFESIDQTKIQEFLPALTVARKVKKITLNPQRLEEDKASFLSEINQTKCCNSSESSKSGESCAKPAQVETKKCCNSGNSCSSGESSKSGESCAKPAQVETKKPKMGVDACCGRGCNGCLIFWHDSKFKKQRELIKTKKLGEILSKSQSKSESEEVK